MSCAANVATAIFLFLVLDFWAIVKFYPYLRRSISGYSEGTERLLGGNSVKNVLARRGWGWGEEG